MQLFRAEGFDLLIIGGHEYEVPAFMDFLPKQTYPIRRGVHPNTAFGLAFALDYARLVEALQANFPVLSELLGEADFEVFPLTRETSPAAREDSRSDTTTGRAIACASRMAR